MSLQGADTLEKPTSLTKADRCDYCGAQAYVSAELGNGTLLFCAHHYQENKKSIDSAAYAVYDERKKLYDHDAC